uniref:Candidate secreted effector n=1 Tax=Meloidogyne incognita TaxID=6306 RepID=A0A914MMG0_MELIC
MALIFHSLFVAFIILNNLNDTEANGCGCCCHCCKCCSCCTPCCNPPLLIKLPRTCPCCCKCCCPCCCCGGGGGKRKRRSIQMSNGVPFPRLNFPISSANAVEDKSCNCSVNEKFNCDDHEVNQPSKMLNLRSRRSQDRN